MAKIIFIEPDGTERAVDAQAGTSLMEAAVNNGVDGIEADCGGVCACATCHVYVAAEWLQAAGPRTDIEEAMLDLAHEPRDSSRLSCQVRVTDALDGLIVSIPESQR
ncbi:2Fe-2S ferredoxin [Sphingopyxis sp. Root214]|uniref:2Fe-2S iron-sulfur cluster-binding protein n=1 Tax=unclassified Sphingopyxis TaxID=2614943 RepID=UPI0006F3102B|nr:MULTISPECIES: 2Fe-2S iron-sulfur cluster-binding protein [unclassified Sphingopyxis]KQZ73775.1 2Fe-2S ferredoxin [Sphingopyxis sp. Root154]KRC07916.1 2Fe-2S ferredoxin [Sphingopyxis sp. Root214]